MDYKYQHSGNKETCKAVAFVEQYVHLVPQWLRACEGFLLGEPVCTESLEGYVLVLFQHDIIAGQGYILVNEEGGHVDIEGDGCLLSAFYVFAERFWNDYHIWTAKGW